MNEPALVQLQHAKCHTLKNLKIGSVKQVMRDEALNAKHTSVG